MGLTMKKHAMGNKNYFLKTDRTFSVVRRYSWVLVPIIAFGSIYFPLLGLGVFAIMIIIMGTGFFQGRYWCGRLCPHGSLFDRVAMPASVFKKIPDIFKSPLGRWGFFALFMVMFGVRLVKITPLWGDPEFLGAFGTVMGRQYLIMPTVIGFSLAIINPRTWCAICPMGTFAQVMYNIGKALKLNKKFDRKVTIDAKDKCRKCAICARVCPVQLEPYTNFDKHNQFSNDFCIRCGTCVAKCPLDRLSITNAGSTLNHIKPY